MKHTKIVFIIVLLLALSSCANDPGKDGADATSDMIQADRYNSLITITGEDPGENCEAGGKRIDTGLDDGKEGGIENDGILQSSEIDSTEYVCNGISGEGGQDGINGTDGENGVDGTDGKDGKGGNDSTPDTVIVHNLSGKFQKGRCWEGGEIRVWPLEDGTLTQLGAHFIGTTKSNGTYNVRAETKEEYVLIYSELTCDDEVNGGSGIQELSGYRKTSDPTSNINVLTKISVPVADSLFDNEFGTVEESLVESERLTLNFLSMPGILERFSKMNLENNGIHDAALLLASSMILDGRTNAEQKDYMSRISTGIIINDLFLKAEILESYSDLPLMEIRRNLVMSYENVGIQINTPPFWRLFAPDYYADLLERTPVVISSYNMDDNTTCSFDQNTYNTFAVPHTFDLAIETSKYIALNFAGNISIWTIGVDGDGNPAPGVKLLDIIQLKEIILDNPVPMVYNGLLGDNHGLVPDIEYYIVIRRDENFTLSKGCGGDRLTTAYTLASDDEGQTWIGHNNNNDRFFYYSGVKMYTVN